MNRVSARPIVSNFIVVLGEGIQFQFFPVPSEIIFKIVALVLFFDTNTIISPAGENLSRRNLNNPVQALKAYYRIFIPPKQYMCIEDYARARGKNQDDDWRKSFSIDKRNARVYIRLTKGK